MLAPTPRMLGTITPSTATAPARGATFAISRTLDSRPTWKSSSITPSSAAKPISGPRATSARPGNGQISEQYAARELAENRRLAQAERSLTAELCRQDHRREREPGLRGDAVVHRRAC